MTVYKVTNLLNNKVYIGQTRGNLRVRWLQHCKSRSHCSALASAIQKYGIENFKIESIETTVCPLVLNYKERQYIKQYNSLAPNGYNLTEGGEGASHTEQSKKKLSEAHKGAKNPMFGKKMSEQHKRKISASLTGRKRPKEVVDKIRRNHNPKSDKNLTYRRRRKLEIAS